MSIGAIVKSILEEYAIQFDQNGRSFILTCPRCSKSEKLYICKSDGHFVCWRCRESAGYTGRPEWVLTDLTGLPVSELKKRLYYGGEISSSVILDISISDWFEDSDVIPTFVPKDLCEVMWHPDIRQLKGSPGQAYLEGRGIPLHVAEHYDIRYWPAKKSVVFPMFSKGVLLGWQTRLIGPTSWVDEETGKVVKVPKSITSTGLKKDQTFMFIDNLIGSDHAILCEGPIDALQCTLAGGGIAALGKAVSKSQLALLKYSGVRKLYIGLDPDAFIESNSMLRDMCNSMEIYDMAAPEPYGDLGEMSMGSVLELYKNAKRIGPTHMFFNLSGLKDSIQAFKVS